MLVRPLELEDLESVVERVALNLAGDAAQNPLINPTFSAEAFALALSQVRDETWVAIGECGVVGHLYAALLESLDHGNGAWVGPDGVSFDDEETLAAIYATAGRAWVERGALEHFVWVRDDEAAARPWLELGFIRVHVRGVVELVDRARTSFAEEYRLRRGGLADLELALDLDRVLDEAERQGPSDSVPEESATRREEWRELLEDDEVHHYVVEFAGDAVAQCLTYPLSPRRGSFADTLHVSAVVVVPDHQRRGVARALLDVALFDAHESGFRYAETNWRVTNSDAAHFWRRYGFVPTYVRLQRTIIAP